MYLHCVEASNQIPTGLKSLESSRWFNFSLSLSLMTLLSQVHVCMVWNCTSCPGHRLHYCWPARQSMSASRQQLLDSVLKLIRISSKLAAYPSSAEFSFNRRCLSISSILFRHSFKSFSSFSICKTSVAQQLVHVYTHYSTQLLQLCEMLLVHFIVYFLSSISPAFINYSQQCRQQN